MTEAVEQAKILRWLEAEDYYVRKAVVSNRKGTLDIYGCTPAGWFLSIEVKFGKNKTSALQDYNIAEIRKRHGIAFVAYSLAEVKQVLQSQSHLSRATHLLQVHHSHGPFDYS